MTGSGYETALGRSFGRRAPEPERTHGGSATVAAGGRGEGV